MTKKALEIRAHFKGDDVGQYVAHTWETYRAQMNTKIEQWKEVRDYIFATDTTTTTNKTLPWKNSTTLPKLCQIRDNLHSNYISALFPNDDWLRWSAYTQESGSKEKVKSIEAYMGNKFREGEFRQEFSRLVYDYIDFGNAFATVDYVSRAPKMEDGEPLIDYIGPKIRRISPYDIIFNPIAASFRDSFKIVRSIKNVGELYMMADDLPDEHYLKGVLASREQLIQNCNQKSGLKDFDKGQGFSMDGFGNYEEYLQSGYVEFLDFYGDVFDQKTGSVRRNRLITVIDRMWTIRDEEIPSWLGHAPIYHVGWRTRSDNLWAMGPLDNLVGMQYRIDHLENLKADAMDLAVLPPLVIKGDVEAFKYGPGEEIHIDEGGDVTELAKNAQWVIAADNSIDKLEMRMEQYAGAPREAMGIRSPGEKTMFEVQQLNNAAGRIFQEKTTHFEVEFLERLLNACLEVSKRNLDSVDTIRVIDNDVGVAVFIDITKEDITASGRLRPIGARHFAAQAQLMQNLQGIYNSQLGEMLKPHTSTKNLATLIEEIMGVERFALFSPNVGVEERKETQRAINQGQEDLAVEASVAPPQ